MNQPLRKKLTKLQQDKITEVLGYRNLSIEETNEEFDQEELANAKHACSSIEKSLFDFEYYTHMNESDCFKQVQSNNESLKKIRRSCQSIIQELETPTTLNTIIKSTFKFESDSTIKSTLKSVKTAIDTLEKIKFVANNEISINEEHVIKNKKITVIGKRRLNLIIDISKIFRLFNCFSASNNEKHSYITSVSDENQTKAELKSFKKGIEEDQLNLIIYCLSILQERDLSEASLSEKRIKEIIKEENLHTISDK
jgi:hypothetical protein